MGSSEPSLVPEWLRSNGHGNSGGGVAHYSSSGKSHSDASLLANSARNRLSRTDTDIGGPRAILDRSSSVNSRRNYSNNGTSKHPYSNFNRNHKDKERENFEHMGKESIRRSHSMVSRRQGDSFSNSDASNFKQIDSNKQLRIYGVANSDKPSSSLAKVSFEKDFPSLGADEKQVPNVVRVASPGLTIPSRSLSIGNSGSIGEGWSALAELPVVNGNNNNGQSNHQPFATSVASSATQRDMNVVSDSSNTASETPAANGASDSSPGLNMAEVLIQPPPTSCITPQQSVDTQRLEQLAIKKVKMLIPMTPSMPKILHSSDKSKSKLNARYGDVNGSNKVIMHPLPSSVSATGHVSRGGPVTSDASKQSHGPKLFVLKPHWENGASLNSKEETNPENSAGGKPTNSIVTNPAMSSNPSRSPNSSKASLMESKSVFSPLVMASKEKQPMSSYAKSRSDFFNSVRKKTSMTTAVASEASNSIKPLSEDKSCEIASESPRGTENGGLVHNNDSSDVEHKLPTGECVKVIPEEEEEAAFLRSLGWKEDGPEVEGITEEEINDFYQDFLKLNPSLNLSRGVRPTPLTFLMESYARKFGIASPKVSPLDAAALKSN